MSDAAARKPKKPIMPPSRIAVLVFAIVGIIVIVFQWHAKSGWDKTYQAIGAVIDDEEASLFQDDLPKYIHGSPTRNEDKQAHTEQFTWKGILQSYTFELQYDSNGFVREIRPK